MNSSSRRLLVTGASGFLGSEIVQLARTGGWHVRALVRNPQRQVDGAEIFVGDIGNPAVLRRASEGVDAVVHAAGLAHVFGRGAGDTNRFKQVNEVGTGNVMDAAMHAGVSHVVLVSSVSVYGSYPGTKCDESASCRPSGAYAISKRRGELKAIERMAKGRGSLVILRLATIYGEGDRGNVAKLIGVLDRGRFIWPGSGENQKSLIYKRDAARACVRALESSAPGTGIFNVSAQSASMREIVTAICEALGRPVPRLGIPLALLRTAGAIARAIGDPGHLDLRLQKFIHHDVYSGEKFETAFDFSPAISLAEGMRREVAFLRSSIGG